MEKKHPFVIGISGGSGSGKSSFVEGLKQRFEGQEICFLSQDMYYKSRNDQKVDPKGIRNFDLPESILREEFLRDVQRLMKGECVTREEYTFNNDKVTARSLEYHPGKVLVLEGLFVFYFKEIFELLDLSVFIEAREDLKIIRRILRDQEERNYPLDDVLYRYQHHVSPSYESYIKPYRSQVDLIINNNKNYKRGLMVLEWVIEKLLKPE